MPHISKEELYQQLTSEQIIERYFADKLGSKPLKKGLLISSPFRPDNNPSFSFYRAVTGRLCAKDHSTEATYSDIDMVSTLLQLNFTDTLRTIASDFGLSSTTPPKPKKKSTDHPKRPNCHPELDSGPDVGTTQKNDQHNVTCDREVLNQVQDDNSVFTSPAAHYYAQYGITSTQLHQYQVTDIPSHGYGAHTVVSTTADPIIGYTCADATKLYRPLGPRETKFRWTGRKPADYCFGLNQLPLYVTDIILTGGEKDVLTLRSKGIYALSRNSETDHYPPELIAEIQQECDHLWVLFDNDETGIRQGQKLAAQHNIGYLQLPDFDGKDISDWVLAGNNVDDWKSWQVEVDTSAVSLSVVEDRGTGQTVSHFDYAQCDTPPTNPSLFRRQLINERMEQAKHTETSKMLFSELWHENEVCILFADTNLGKSILAIQIAESIANGNAIQGFKQEAPAQAVLYFDFELSDKQLELRYAIKQQGQNTLTDHYVFSPNLSKIDIDPDAEPPLYQTFEQFLHHSLEQEIIQSQAKILIIDNLTYLKNETEKAKDALPLMKHLKALKTRHGLSILALAHTPKRDLTKPITRNDLQGSKMLINFVDSSFALGESTQDPSLRYIKQIKARNTEILYGTDSVILCQLQKPHNFLGFHHLQQSTEREHLRQLSDGDRDERISQALEMKQRGMSNRMIAKEMGVSHTAVRKWLKSMENE